MRNKAKGFTLVEVLVGSALFLVVAVAVYSSFVSLMKLANGSQARILAVQLATEQFEIVRNLPYTDIGLTTGIPLGVLSQNQVLSRGGVNFNVLLTIRNINLSTSTVQASDKLVEVTVDCPLCPNFQPVTITGQISPSNLQSAGLGGALVTQVFNGNGEPVQDATVDVQSVSTSSVQNTDVTNNQGILNIIGVPPGTNAYKIVVSKTGYSTEETFPIGGSGNPNPTKPNVTVLDQQVSQISFVIDKLSALRFSSVTPLCVPVGNIDFSITGAKNIGASVPKFSQNLSTNGSGVLNLNDVEWDTYTITPTDAGYDIAGINPDSPFSLNPDNVQDVQLVVVPKDLNSVMVSVIDNSTSLPVSGATVVLSKGVFTETKTTGQGYLTQDDWSAGAGQDLLVNQAQYYTDNGTVDTATSSGDVLLRDFFGLYNTNATGTLESSTFDTGTTSNYYSLYWTPNNQPLPTGANSLKIQFASNASATDPWVFLGPDGSSDSYYTTPGSAISNVHNGKQFARYKTFLTTETSTSSPKLSSLFFSYTSGCVPPGQVLFQDLGTGQYDISVSKGGYDNFAGQIDIVNGWQNHKVYLTIP